MELRTVPIDTGGTFGYKCSQYLYSFTGRYSIPCIREWVDKGMAGHKCVTDALDRETEPSTGEYVPARSPFGRVFSTLARSASVIKLIHPGKTQLGQKVSEDPILPTRA